MNKTAIRIPITILGVIGIISCAHPWCIEVRAAAPLLEEPYPLDYPSSGPLPNRVTRVLEKGRYTVLQQREGKDYVAYEIEGPHGVRGYVIGAAAVQPCE